MLFNNVLNVDKHSSGRSAHTNAYETPPMPSKGNEAIRSSWFRSTRHKALKRQSTSSIEELLLEFSSIARRSASRALSSSISAVIFVSVTSHRLGFGGAAVLVHHRGQCSENQATPFGHQGARPAWGRTCLSNLMQEADPAKKILKGSHSISQREAAARAGISGASIVSGASRRERAAGAVRGGGSKAQSRHRRRASSPCTVCQVRTSR
jgi:hypothetical protein